MVSTSGAKKEGARFRCGFISKLRSLSPWRGPRRGTATNRLRELKEADRQLIDLLMIPAAIGDCDLTGKGEGRNCAMGVGCTATMPFMPTEAMKHRCAYKPY